MVQVVALTVFALLLARVLRSPPGAWRWVLGGAAAVLVGSQLLPEGSSFRADVASSGRTLFWIALGLAPVAAYAVAVRGLRRRAGTDTGLAPRPSPRGLVQFPQDATLAAETAMALAEEAAAALPGARVSLGWRGGDGSLEGHLRLRLCGDRAEVEMLRVAPNARGRGVGRDLLRAGEREAAAQGARRIGALVGDWQAPGFFASAGFTADAPHDLGGGMRRRWMEKAL